MPTAKEANDMVKYQFRAEDDDWQAWKNTVPRSKSLEKRINELIKADTEGRVDEINLGRLEDALDDIEAAAERGDGAGLQDALERAREAVGDA